MVTFMATPTVLNVAPSLSSFFLSSSGTFTCNTFIRKNELFGPPGFPGLMQRSRFPSSCAWRFIGSGGGRVRFRLLYFDIPENEGCSQDGLKVYDGMFESRPLLANLCGTLTENVVMGTGKMMLVKLNAGSFNAYRGFHGVFEML